MKLTKKLVVFDLETTGTWLEKDKVIEIAMIKCQPDGTQETYDKRINPGMPIPPVISRLVGISDEDVKNAPRFHAVAQEILNFLKDCDLAGFNLVRFDLPILEREFRESGHEFLWRDRKVYDVQRVFHLTQKRDLNAAYEFYCQKSLQNAHTAMADTQATFEILQAQITKHGNGEMSPKVLDKFQYRQTGEFFDRERKFRWWNGKLYMMFGKYARKQTLQEVAQRDSGYLEWMLSADFSDEIKSLVQNALTGKFPNPPSETKNEIDIEETESNNTGE